VTVHQAFAFPYFVSVAKRGLQHLGSVMLRMVIIFRIKGDRPNCVITMIEKADQILCHSLVSTMYPASALIFLKSSSCHGNAS